MRRRWGWRAECWLLLLLLPLLTAQPPAVQTKEHPRRSSYTRLRLASRQRWSSTSESPPKARSDLPLGYIILSMKDDVTEPSATRDKNEETFEEGSSTARVLELDPATDLEPETSADAEEEEEIGRRPLLAGFLKREVWTIPLLAIAGINMLLITLFEVFVLCRAKGRGPLFLGQVLLLALFLCSALSLLFVLRPTSVRCWVGRLGISLAYSLLFAGLMVKCVFLLSLESGVSLPRPYQSLLLVFALLPQVAINLQWILNSPPPDSLSMEGALWSQCGTSFSEMLLTSTSYNVFLILLLGVLALKTRGIRDNYRESTYIGFSILVTVPIWIAWTIAGWILQGKHQDACVAFGLVVQSSATFLIMFMPKGRQLAAMGKEGMFVEDQDDACSGYSPSFFHFKPIKTYKTTLLGDANLYTTLEPTISTLNPNVFFHRSDFHPGMIY